MLLTTFIIDYKVVFTAECKAPDSLDMNKIVFLPASFPPSFQLFWRQPPAKDFLCFNLQYTHSNLINTVAVRNGDHIGWVTGHLYHAAILLCVLCLSIILSVNKTKIFTPGDFISMKRRTFLTGNWAALQTLAKRDWPFALTRGHGNGLRAKRARENGNQNKVVS